MLEYIVVEATNVSGIMKRVFELIKEGLEAPGRHLCIRFTCVSSYDQRDWKEIMS